MNWRSPGDTVRLIDSLVPNVADGLRFVVLDNGSGDDSDAILREHFAKEPLASAVTYLTTETNLGFCGGVNLAVDAALSADPRPDYIWMLNPDVALNAAVLPELLAVQGLSGAAIVTVRFREKHGFAGERRWPMPLFAPMRMWHQRPVPGSRWWTSQRYHGACVLIHRDVVMALRDAHGEFLDSRLFLYYDEWVTSLRAERLGFQVAVAAHPEVEHLGTYRSPDEALRRARQHYGARNAILAARWTLPWWQVLVLTAPTVARNLLWNHPRDWVRLLRGAADGVRGKHGIWEHHPR